ncbi:MAG TPA: HD domain-containing protein [Thermomicrobiales bacterium]|nr:HD domain-containing protein [Thermomicrobiales bacterium]
MIANARVIALAETAAGAVVRLDIVEAACWLHDIVQFPKGSGPAGEAARHSAAESRRLLEMVGAKQEEIERVAHAIEAHSYSGGVKPCTLEAAIVQDADRLDALGAVGLARLWVTAAELNSVLYDDVDPAAMTRPLDDLAFGLDHIQAKLLTLPGTMNTRSGRDEAERRASYVAAYRAEFLSELGGLARESLAPSP